MYFCVFSYNRGILLENCIRSIEHCATGSEIIIFDDNSRDPYTQTVLAEASKKHRIITPEKENQAGLKCGGLYNNMQAALGILPAEAQACFLQDDMQLVRKINREDLESIKTYFDCNPDAAFLQPAFLRGSNRERDTEKNHWHQQKHAYIRNDGKQSAGIYFSAVSIVLVERLLKSNWVFQGREKDNDKQARQAFSKMGFMRDPILIWLPNVPAFRGKKKTLALKIAEKTRKSGFYPVAYLSEQQNQAFKNRPVEHLPIAEDFLQLKSGELPKPWHHHPLEGNSLLKQLNRIELKLRALFKTSKKR